MRPNLGPRLRLIMWWLGIAVVGSIIALPLVDVAL
jgi:hypothetical protein